MKYKTTAKAIRQEQQNGVKCFSVGYCDMQTLLKNHAPLAYTCGVYGWNFDIYCLYGVNICTGYRGMIGSKLKGLHEAEQEARAIDYLDENRSEKIENILIELLKSNGVEI